MAFNLITTLAIGLLFFLHDTNLSREAVVQGRCIGVCT